MTSNTISNLPTERASARLSKLMLRSNAFKICLALAAGFLIGIPTANAQTNLSKADIGFIMAAAQGGRTEVKLGELALQNGFRDDVKAFGQAMVKDHEEINADLKSLVDQKGLVLSYALDAKHQKMVDKLSALTGSKFDDAYIDCMEAGHKMDFKEFTDIAATTKDAELKGFVDKSIPVVEFHLSRISAMKKLGPDGTAMPSVAEKSKTGN